MTGIILPEGRIGDVSGIRKKAEAAREAGVKRVLVPLGQKRELEGIEIGGEKHYGTRKVHALLISDRRR